MNLTSSEKYLVDTNVLVYSVNRAASLHEKSKELLETGLQQGISFAVAHQNLIEFIAVLTRAYRIDRKQAIEDAHVFASRFETIFPLPTTLDTFFQLITENKTTYSFDLYLAATMLDNQITHIITENAKDFQGLGLEEVVQVSRSS